MNALVTAAVARTYPGLQTPANYSIGYKCLIGVKAGNPAAFDSADIDAFIPLDCDQDPSRGGLLPVVADFTGAGPTGERRLRSDRGDKCNVIVLTGNVTTGYYLARVMGIDRGNTGVVTSAACRGLCGELPERPNSMSSSSSTIRPAWAAIPSAGQTRTFWAKKAANELINSLDTARGTQEVGAVSIPATTVHPPRPSYFPLATDLDAVRSAIRPRRRWAAPRRSSKAWPSAPRRSRPAPDQGTQHVLVFVSDGRANPDTTSTARPTPAEVAAFQGVADQVYSVAMGRAGAAPATPTSP